MCILKKFLGICDLKILFQNDNISLDINITQGQLVELERVKNGLSRHKMKSSSWKNIGVFFTLQTPHRPFLPMKRTPKT